MGDLDALCDPRYTVLWQRARAHVENRNGAVAGTFSVKGRGEELRALNGLFGTDRSPGPSGYKVEAARLDETLRAGYGIGLVAFLERTGPRLRPKKDAEARERGLRARVLAPARESCLSGQDWYEHWLEAAKGTITSLVNNEDTRTLARAVRVLEAVVGARTPWLLPKLAVRTTGDTKALNEGAGTLPSLVLRALAQRSGTTLPRDAGERRALWEEHDVVADDLASRVLVLGLPARGAGLGQWLTDAAERGVPFQVTLHQLVNMPVTVDAPVVHVCENPAVLRMAAEDPVASSAPLLCTEGWPSAAFHRLAGAVRAGGGRMYHHGDFDRAGLAITRRMIERHGALPWRMGAVDYLSHEAEERQRAASAPGPTPWDPGLERAMAERGYAVFEESVSDVLLADLRVQASGG